MRSKTLVVFALGISIQFTVCTGGLFVIPDAIAAGPLTQDEAYGAMSIPSCLSEVQSHQQGKLASASANGCEDRDACLVQSHHTNHDRAVAAFDVQYSEPASVNALSFHESTVSSPALKTARAGPLYAYAPLLSHTLLKRE